MEQVTQIMGRLADAGVEVYLAEDKLKARALKGGLSPEYLNLIKTHKPQIIAYLNSQNSAQLSKRPPISVERREPGGQATSYAQQRLWFIDQMDEGSSHYNMPSAMRLTGNFAVDVATQAFQAIIQRHEVLRTVFADEGSGPVQIVQSAFEFSITVTDLSHVKEAVQQTAIQDAIKDDASKPFDLTKDLMLRVSYWRQNATTGVLLFNMHHIASDGWSMALLIHEFVQLYECILSGKADPLPPLPVQYVDYAQWQRHWLKGDLLASQLQYWEQQLAGLPPVHHLPLDHERPVMQSFRGASHHFTISSATLAALKALALSQQTTLFMLLHAAFSVVIARHANHPDVVIGTPVANRLQQELQPLIGFFVNTLVLRTDCANNPCFIDYLQQVKAVNLAAQSNQDVPFELLVDRLKPERSTRYGPLFQILFSLNTNEQQTMNLPGVKLSPVSEHQAVSAKYDLALLASENDGALHARFEYACDLFTASTIQNLADSLHRILVALIDNPKQPIMSLPMLSDTSIHHLLYELNRTERAFPRGQCLHQLFAAQAALTPELVAVTDAHGSISYQQLNDQANQLAHRLIQQGVQPDQIIGLCLPRSVLMVVGLMAILKAGAAYLPLDSNQPVGRLNHMINDAQLRCVLTTEETTALIEPLISDAGIVLSLDGQAWTAAAASYPTDNPHVNGLSAAHLAYVIYTSGSTGLPKGVMVEHRSAVNSLQARLHHYSTAVHRFLLISPIAFDSSVAGLMWSLCSGAQLVIPSQSAITDPDALSALIQHHQISHTLMTPALYSALLGMGENNQLASLKVVIVAGESFADSLPELHHQLLPNTRLYNEYGPTEGSVWSTATELMAEGETPAGIGSAISNVRLYVLDTDRRLLPFGSVGELYIAGAGLARGYLNQTKLTDEKFITHQLAPGLSERLYQTGDLVRYRKSAQLQFIGRVDEQVKIRGYRIELAEIEHALQNHPAVRQGLIVVQQTTHEDNCLVAYFTSDSSQSESALMAEVQSHLRHHLPEYMLPVGWVRLDQFPLTHNGKIDKQALPEPPLLTATGEFVAPANETEQRLTELWSKLLKIPAESISTQANFFHLGGHSLLCIRLLAEIRSAMHCAITVSDIFTNPQLDHMAKFLSQAKQQKQTAIEPKACEGEPLITSYAQQRLWFIDQMDGGSAHYNIPAAMQVTGDFDLKVAERALATIIQRHAILRTVYTKNTEGSAAPQQIIRPDFNFILAVIDFSGLTQRAQSEKVQQAIRSDASKAFDLSRDLMLRVQYLRLNDRSGVLLFNVHHIAADGWSMGLLTREFTQLYCGFLAGEPNSLPPLDIKYADFALWQRAQWGDAALDQQAQYWEQQLARLPVAHDLPLDFTRPQHQTFKGALHHFSADAQLLQALQDLASQNQVTLFMVIHAAFAIWLARHANNPDVVIGTPVANRPHQQLESLIGFFVNTLVLRCDCTENRTFEEFLQQIKDINLQAQNHQDIPFEHLVDRLQPNRNSGHNALFQIMLSMDSNETFELALPNVQFKGLMAEEVSAKFDLILNVQPSDDLHLSLQYNTRLFLPSTIQRWADSLLSLLHDIVQNPQQTIHQLNLVPVAAQHQLFKTLKGQPLDCPRTMGIHQLFEQQAAAHPDDVALISAAGQHSYQQLNQQANQMAHHLIGQGVRPGDVVGLCLSRSPELIASVLAILKTGAAYLPLDPSLPQARLSYMVKESAVRCVVTTSGMLDPSIAPQIEWHQLAASNETMPEKANPINPAFRQDQAAYVIYTSGTTGQPKGVVQRHQTVVNLVHAQTAQGGLNQALKTLQFAPISFDVSIQELATCWLTNSPLVLITETEKQALNELPAWLARQQIQRLFLPPAVFNLLAEICQKYRLKLPLLEEIIVAGEALVMTTDAQQFLSRHPACQLWNHYGPTETHVATTYRVNGGHASGAQPIGHVLPNLSALILDQRQQLSPIGVVGELWLAGDGLAHGYIAQQQLTAERFVSDPTGAAPEKIYYRTGDLVRLNDLGELLFMGRMDQQLQLRGYRIEPAEIVQKMRALPAVEGAHIGVLQSGDAPQALVAYFTTADPHQEGLVDAIKQALRQQLPDYMIPTFWVPLSEFPLTANGKIDQQALPEPDQIDNTVSYQAPVGPVETQLVQIWGELLKIPPAQISRDAHFFELGGHSLLSIRLLTEISAHLGCELGVRAIFDHATLSAMATLINPSGANTKPAIKPLPRGAGELLTSFAQQRLWFIDQLAGGSHHYNMPFAMQLTGDFQLDAANQALQQIIARHEVLRTVYADGEQGPIQIIQAEFEFGITEINLSTHSSAAQADMIQAALSEDAQKPFDLSRDLMLRASFLRLGDEQGVLLFNMHHIATDGWSLGVLVDEFVQLYQAGLNGQAASLPALPVQYADFAHWQRNWLCGETLETQLSYWSQQLADLPQVHQLPLDHDRPQMPSFQGAAHTLNIPAEQVAQLSALALEQNCTLFMVMHAAFSVLIARYANHPDVVIGTPVANRLQQELQPLIGFFVNTLVLRSDCSNNPSFVDFLQHIKDVNLAAQSHQDVPFEQLVDHLNPVRNTGHHALFQIMLSMDTNEQRTLELPGVSMAPVINNDAITAKFDLLLIISEQAKNLTCRFEYNTALFNAETIQRMADSFGRLLAGVAVDPEQPIQSLPLISETEKNLLLYGLNQTQVDFPHDQCLHQLFEAQVRSTPERLAVLDGEESMTYQSLNAQANQLAHHLIEQGAQAGQIIGLCAQRSLPMMVALLGILKTGAACMPLDPTLPQARLQHMISDGDLYHVLTQQNLLEITADSKVHHCVIDDVAMVAQLAQYPDHNPTVPMLTSHHLAYVLYTSGSTGLPKGVMLEHLGLCNLCHWHNDRHQITAADCGIHMASIGFDAGILEIWPLLSRGGRVLMVPDEHRTEPAVLKAWINQHQVTHCFLTTALLEAAYDDFNTPDCPSLRCLITGGEKLTRNAFANNTTQLINIYGPTESSVLVTQFVTSKNQSSAPPIGQPIHNMRTYVVSGDLTLLPHRCVGELCVAGVGLARGYLNQPELTADRFIELTLDDGLTERVYRTGDWVRYAANGQLEYVGRTDKQVKIRGFRIEVGEVEYRLNQLSAVSSCVVVVDGEDRLNQQLIAYVVLNVNTDRAGVADLKQQLKQNLPAYMVPSHIHEVDHLPYNANGKIDQRKLSELVPTGPTSSHHSPAETAAEQALVAVLASVLKLEQGSISMLDNFFDLGGQSLSLIKVVNALKAQGIKQSIKAFYECDTLRDVCEFGQTVAMTGADCLIKLNESKSHQKLFLLHPMGGRVDCYQPLAAEISAVTAVYGIQAPFVVDQEFAFSEIRQLANHYADVIQGLQPAGPYRLGGWSIGGMIAQHVAQVLISRGHEVAYFIALDSFMEPPYQQHSEDVAALREVVAFVKGQQQPVDHFFPAEFADRDFHEHIEFAAKSLLAGDDSGTSEQQVMMGLRFGVNVLQADLAVSSITPSQQAVLGIAAHNTDRDLLLQGWQAAVAGKSLLLELPAAHLHVLEGDSLQLIAQQIKYDLVTI